VGFGFNKEEVKDDAEGMNTMKILGENMAWLLKKNNAQQINQAGVKRCTKVRSKINLQFRELRCPAGKAQKLKKSAFKD